jgi:hypothetical protein
MTITERGTGHRTLRGAILAVGALAGAIFSVIALSTTLWGWFDGDAPGKVTKLGIRGIRPLTYGQWRSHEGVPNRGLTRPQRNAAGKLITFEVATQGYDEGQVLPLRIFLNDTSRASSKRIGSSEILVRHGDSCGCREWVPVPKQGTRYFLEIAVYPPGKIRGEPLRSVLSRIFTART